MRSKPTRTARVKAELGQTERWRRSTAGHGACIEALLGQCERSLTTKYLLDRGLGRTLDILGLQRRGEMEGLRLQLFLCKLALKRRRHCRAFRE